MIFRKYSGKINFWTCDIYVGRGKVKVFTQIWSRTILWYTLVYHALVYHLFTEKGSKLITMFVCTLPPQFYHLTCCVFLQRAGNFGLSFPTISDSEVLICHKEWNRIVTLNGQRKSFLCWFNFQRVFLLPWENIKLLTQSGNTGGPETY